MTLIRAEYPAGEHERFAERVADDFIGKPVTDDKGVVIGAVVRAWVENDGRKIVYEAEVEGLRGRDPDIVPVRARPVDEDEK